jgi:hypothetical protein
MPGRRAGQNDRVELSAQIAGSEKDPMVIYVGFATGDCARSR